MFVVGCSRSGTTLLQSIISNSPQYKAFPEANVLYHVLDDLYTRQYPFSVGTQDKLKAYLLSLLNRLGYSRKFNNEHIENFLINIKRPDLEFLLPKEQNNIREVFIAFKNILNEAAGESYWIEKTPQNIFCIDLMQKYYPDDTFVHIIRAGKDNVSSLIDAARKYDDFANRFGGIFGLNRAIDYWNSSIKFSYSMKKRPNHFFIRFEELVAEPTEALASLSQALDIDITQEMIKYNTEKIITPKEHWKKQSSNEVKKPEEKFKKIFNINEQNLIVSKLIDLEEYFPLRRNSMY